MAGINVSRSQANAFAAAYRRISAAPARPIIDTAPASAPSSEGGASGLSQEQLDAQSVVGRLGEEGAAAVANGSGGIPTVTRNAGESDAAFADRIRSTPIQLNGPVESSGGTPAAKSASVATTPVNRSIIGSQNSLGGANISGSYNDNGTDFRTQAEKDAQSFLDTQAPPKTEEQLVKEKTDASKGLIDSLNGLYDTKLSDQAKTNELNSAETNAQSVLRGLMGSTEAGNRAVAASERGNKANAGILAEKQTALQNIYTKIQTDAKTEAYTQLQNAKVDAKDVLARAEADRTKAVENVKILAGAGFDLSSIKANDPETYKGLVQKVGGEDKLNALFVINRPKNDVVGTPIRVGDHYVQMYKNPLTGAVTAENVKLPDGLPDVYSKFETIKDAAGNQVLVAIPDNWDGDVSKLKKVGGGSTGTDTPTTYVAGANPVVDSWANRIQNGSAKLTDIPASQVALRNSVSVALDAMGNTADGKPTTTELGKAALSTAKGLLEKFNAGKGTSAVGKSGILGSFGYGLIPGTDRANFLTDLNSLKSQLALDGVKYLKGQGAVSDSERALLAQATTKLNAAQSEDEFKKTLEDIINKLSGPSSSSQTAGTVAPAPAGYVNIKKPDGTVGSIPEGNLDAAIKLGAVKI